MDIDPRFILALDQIRELAFSLVRILLAIMILLIVVRITMGVLARSIAAQIAAMGARRSWNDLAMDAAPREDRATESIQAFPGNEARAPLWPVESEANPGS